MHLVHYLFVSQTALIEGCSLGYGTVKCPIWAVERHLAVFCPVDPDIFGDYCGKSDKTLYEFQCNLSHMLHRKGYDHKWWYEEEQGHPVYVYDDYKTMQKIVDDLSNGNYRKVIDMALKGWHEFAASVQLSSDIIIVDSCLFGYLTWSLFPFITPKQEITQYVKDVERIIKPLNPHLIYFYQSDIGAALKKICTRRGGDTEKNFVRAATQSPYGKSRGLNGFEGMVAYWQDYRCITDEAYQGLGCPKIAIDNSEENWSLYGHKISEFLRIGHSDEVSMVQQDLQQLVGFYLAETDGAPVVRFKSNQEI